MLVAILDFVIRKAADLAPSLFHSYLSEKAVHLHDFVLEAIGVEECLSPDNNEPGTVSLDAIDIRLGILQREDAHRASKCGVPDLTDQSRREKIKEILTKMTISKKLTRGRCANTWRLGTGSL